jgi:transcriptional regulator with XRE-family HTH domain
VEKSIRSPDHQYLCKLLTEYRDSAGLTQRQVAEGLEKPQSFVSKYESGERRLDLVELQQVVAVLGVSLEDFVEKFVSGTRHRPPL